MNFPAAMETTTAPEIIVIEDNAANVRFTVPEWLKTPPDGNGSKAETAKWILLKMTEPVATAILVDADSQRRSGG